tara:strand:- start:356 stop:529 length:174 start_codon:yes stop_codon:yes gene_type:complete
MHTPQTKNDQIREWVSKCPSWYEVGQTFIRQVEETVDGKSTGQTFAVKSMTITVDVE